MTEGKKWGSVFTCRSCSGRGLILSFLRQIFFFLSACDFFFL